VVRVENLGKRFKIYARPLDRMLEWMKAGKRHKDFWAVRGVSFQLRRGECLGIIGANGSGKSTLLKMITGALYPTEGSYSVDGRVLSLIELGTGLNMHLSGRANVGHSASLLGFPANFAREKMDEIEAFADLGEFFDRPVNLYSSGMRVRLAFSMFACFRPEVLIVDEALSVGDVFFQQKCAGRIRELLDAGMTMIFVSHDQSAVLNLCDRAVLLDRGRVAFQGLPSEAVHRYSAHLHQKPRYGPKREPGATPAPAAAAGLPAPGTAGDAAAVIKGDIIGERSAQRFGNGDMKFLAVRVTDTAGRETRKTMMGERLVVEALLEAVRPVHEPRTGINLFDRFDNLVFAAGSYQTGCLLPDLEPGDRVIVRFELSMDVHPGEYTFGLGASLPSEQNPEHGVACDRLTHLGPLLVLQDRGKVRPFYGVARLDLTVTHRSAGSA
jgi:ABC-type polysaccharide/polyol phosphate transport system ATPase subunit